MSGAAGGALAKSEPTAEDLDRFASSIKASWDLDDAPFAAGPAPAAAELAALMPAPAPVLDQGASFAAAPKPAPAAIEALAPTLPAAVPVPGAPAPTAAPAASRPPPPAPFVAPAVPAPAAFSPPRVAPIPSTSDLSDSFEVPKKRTGLFVGIGIAALVLVGGAFFMLKPGDAPKDAPPITKTVEAPRENVIPPPPPVEEVPKATAKPETKPAEPKPEVKPQAAEPKPEKPQAVAAPEPKPRPAPHAAAPRPEPRPAPAPHPPAAKPPPSKGGGNGGIVRDVPF